MFDRSVENIDAADGNTPAYQDALVQCEAEIEFERRELDENLAYLVSKLGHNEKLTDGEGRDLHLIMTHRHIHPDKLRQFVALVVRYEALRKEIFDEAQTAELQQRLEEAAAEEQRAEKARQEARSRRVEIYYQINAASQARIEMLRLEKGYPDLFPAGESDD